MRDVCELLGGVGLLLGDMIDGVRDSLWLPADRPSIFPSGQGCLQAPPDGGRREEPGTGKGARRRMHDAVDNPPYSLSPVIVAVNTPASLFVLIVKIHYLCFVSLCFSRCLSEFNYVLSLLLKWMVLYLCPVCASSSVRLPVCLSPFVLLRFPVTHFSGNVNIQRTINLTLCQYQYCCSDLYLCQSACVQLYRLDIKLN